MAAQRRSSWERRCLTSLVHWLIYSLVHCFNDSFSLIHWFNGRFTDSLLHWFVDSLVYWSIDSLINDSLLHWFIGSLLHCSVDSLVYWSIDSFIQCLIHLFIGSLIHSVSCVRILSCHFIGISTTMCSFVGSTLRCFCISKTFLYTIFFLQLFLFSKLPPRRVPGTTDI